MKKPAAQKAVARGAGWDGLSPWTKRAAALLPCLAVLGVVAPYASSVFGTPPYASKAVEARIALAEQRIDLQERIVTQREILKLEEEAKKRKLMEAERNYLQDLKTRLNELERSRGNYGK